MKNLKTFQAETMAEAIEQVKRRLGRDAVILHTRTRSRGGVLGFGRRSIVEVTAAANSGLPTTARRGIVRKRSGQNVGPGGADGAAMPAHGTSLRGVTLSDPDVLAEIGELRSMIAGLVHDGRRRELPTLPEELLDTYTRLTQADVAEDLAIQLVERVRAEMAAGQPAGSSAPGWIRQRLAAFIESMLPVAGPIRLNGRAGPTVIAFVGPTGVGKTTTVAKLAASFSLREGRKVGLITIDTHRVAAVEQLRTYAQIIDVPLEVVTVPAQLHTALDAMHDRDVILLDTAGRSQNDETRLTELKRFLDEVRPHEVHLVLSGTCSRHALLETVNRFGAVGVDRVIFTKLDEAVGFGAILSCLHQAKAGLSYLTAGQDVPDDIEVGHGRRIAELIVHAGRSTPCLK